MSKRIKLMADYGGTVLWGADPTTIGPIAPETLPISKSLRLELQEWANVYDLTLNSEDPTASGFASAEAENHFEEQGRRLWQALKRELGEEYLVSYFSNQDSRVYS